MIGRAPALAVILAVSGCGGDVHTVDVRLADNLVCERSLQELSWVGIEVVRQSGEDLELVDDLTTCLRLPDGVRQVDQLFDVVREAGVTVDGVPAEPLTILRFVGYGQLGPVECPRGAEHVCGITCPPVSAEELPAEGVKANFVCESLEPNLRRAYNGCLNIEGLTEENRARICPQPE